jgi:hypothetical protein
MNGRAQLLGRNVRADRPFPARQESRSNTRLKGNAGAVDGLFYVKSADDVTYWHVSSVQRCPTCVCLPGLNGREPDIVERPVLTLSGHCITIFVALCTLVTPLVRSRPFGHWFKGESCRRMSGFGKSGICSCSETREQFHELGMQSFATRGSERVKSKKWHFGLLGQHVILRSNDPLHPFSRRASPALHFLLLNQKSARPPTRRWFR